MKNFATNLMTDQLKLQLQKQEETLHGLLETKQIASKQVHVFQYNIHEF